MIQSYLPKLGSLMIVESSDVYNLEPLSKSCNLIFLELKKMQALKCLPDSLPSLKHLALENCNRIKVIPSLKGYSSLKRLTLKFCNKLQSLPIIPFEHPLLMLSIRHCTGFVSLGKVSNASLRALELVGIKTDNPLLRFGQCPSLESIDFSMSSSIQDIVGFNRENCPLLKTAVAICYTDISSSFDDLREEGVLVVKG